MKTILLIAGGWVLALSSFAQLPITITLENYSALASHRAPIFGVDPVDVYLSKSGNTSTGLPVGSQTYNGAPLAGSVWKVQLLAAPYPLVEDSLLVPQFPVTSFSGTDPRIPTPGFFDPVKITLAGLPADATAACCQVVVWDNSSGLFPTWSSAEAAWDSGLIPAGKSTIGIVPLAFGTTSFIRSFNVYIIPEPGAVSLSLLGLLAIRLAARR